MAPPLRPPVLVGDGVVLRGHLPHDVPGIVRQCRDPITRRWTRVPVPFGEEDALSWIERTAHGWASATSFGFAVEADGAFAGSVDLRDLGAGGFDVGFGLTPSARGRGIATRSLRTLLPWAFAEVGAEVVHWAAMAGNWASRRVAWSVGFQVEGTVRGLVEQRGARFDGWTGSLRARDDLRPAHPWYLPPRLAGGGVVLRPHHDDDVRTIVEACNDDRTQRWLTQLPRPYTRTDALAHLEEIREDAAGGRGVFWAVADPESDEMIGEVGLWGLAHGESHQAEAGYWTHPARRDAGLTKAALRLAVRHAVLPEDDGGLGISRVLVRAAASNLASQGVAEGIGFRFAGRDREAELMRDGSTEDLLRFDLLARELR